MTQRELTLLNLGQNLDDLSNLDPRGYGVCRILYQAAQKHTGFPLSMNAALQLEKTVKENDLVYIISGFVLRPYNKAETDGIVSSVLLARSLVKAFNAKPVIICPEDCIGAVANMSCSVGLHLHYSIESLMACPVSMAVIPFTKDIEKAKNFAKKIISQGEPSAVVSIEAPGANRYGEYHNAVGLNVTELEAKSDILFDMLRDIGVMNIAIGDLGNEIGMATIGDQLEKYIPYATKGKCNCDCKGGIAAKSVADNIITATVSDWGCYGMIAALAYLKRDLDIMHDAELERDVLTTAARSGMIDMYGWLIPAIDGFGLDTTTSVVTLMRECVLYALKLEKTCQTWFEKVIELGYYE